MRSFEILVESERSSLATAASMPLAAPPRSGRRARTSDVLDLFIHGANVTARVAERHASCVLRDLAWALAELSMFARQKRIVRFYEDAWELCVERLGDRAMLSVYRGGAEPTVLVYDRDVVFEEMCESVLDALEGAIERSQDDRPSLLEAKNALVVAREHPLDLEGVVIPEPLVLSIDADRDAPISFAVELSMRPGPTDSLEESVERADLHALLARGRMQAEIRGRAMELGDICPFLFAERLLDLARRGLDKWERGQAFFARVDAGGVMVGIRMGAGESPAAALTISRDQRASTRTMPAAISTFPELPFFDVVEAALSFGRALVRGIVRRDRTQGGNLRLGAFRRDLRQLGDQCREMRRQDSRINPAPESYRAFALRAPKASTTADPFFANGRLRYQQRWRALVPGIDLRSTFLCGDRLVIGAANETYCLDRQTGELNWRKNTPRAASVVTPNGIARIGNDGSIQLHDFTTGEVILRTWIAPRNNGPCAGAVVSSPGLPRLLIVTEGDRHLVAIDLTSGEARWRYTWGKAGVLRMKRVGKLLYVASGDSALTAVDVQTGSVVWRARDRLRFRATPTADHDVLFAVAGGDGSAAVVHAIDPFSGRPIWDARLSSPLCSVEGPAFLASNSVCVAVRDRRGLCLTGLDRETGETLFSTENPVAPVGTSWLAVDDLLVGNTPGGELVGIDASTGQTRWKHAFGGSAECDTPRRLEPVLRSGALFVPHVDVQIVRPSDGAHLGTVGPCEAIPDLLRVDERCDVYVAEESGHMVAFGSGPRLSLVR